MSNTLTVTGNLTADPELRFTNAGKAVVNFTIADNHYRKNQDGTFEQTGTTFIRAQAWGHQAEQIASTAHKGQRITTTGTLKQRDYDDREGVKRTAYELHVDEFAVPVAKFPPRNAAPQQQPPVSDPWGSAPATSVPF